jgi:hypothetical protein
VDGSCRMLVVGMTPQKGAVHHISYHPESSSCQARVSRSTASMPVELPEGFSDQRSPPELRLGRRPNRATALPHLSDPAMKNSLKKTPSCEAGEVPPVSTGHWR